MDLATRSTSRERGPSSNYSTYTATESHRNSSKIRDSTKNPDENHSTLSMPKGLGGMLKTTTETGNIGLFSIKPSRVPLPTRNARRGSGPYKDEATRRPRQFQPYDVRSADDRQRLPSYTRDASSEVISMYETASQKSRSRAFDDPDCRSYSMTQAYSPYSLSNHRSYTSLRSQPDPVGPLQRPRSPLAYPSRLKRPGFRPSSPALTDGGAVDYRRRAEIDRTPYGASYHRASPSSLYAQKRTPHLSLRPEANRSTPSLLTPSSPKRRSPSPNARQRSRTPNSDWQRRNDHASITTSPARSTFSLASTVNLHNTAHAPSTATTPGKIPPPSPLYYDYTEDFDVDNYNQTVPLDPPPQFRVDRTIPEDRPLSSAWTSLEGSEMQRQKPNFSILRNSTSTPLVLQKSQESSRDSTINTHYTSVWDSNIKPSGREPSIVVKRSTETDENAEGDRKTIRLSGLGLRARELSTHVEEVFGLPPSTSFEVLVPHNITDYRDTESANNVQKEYGKSPPVANFAHSCGAHLRRFPSPSSNLDGQFSEINASPVLNLMLSTPREICNAHIELQNGNMDSVGTTGNTDDAKATSPFHPRSSSLQPDRKKLGQLDSTDDGLSEFNEIVNSFEQVNPTKPEKHQIQDSIEVLHKVSPNSPKAPLLGNGSAAQLFNPLSSLIESRLGHNDEGIYERGTNTILSPSDHDVPNFSHQFPRKSISRSASPMLAPKPISPARQLRLKNSVPQLMKALPALPPDSTICAVSPPLQLALADVELPCRFSPLLPKSHVTPIQGTLRSEDAPSMAKGPGTAASAPEALEPVELDTVVVTAQKPKPGGDEPRSPTPLPKLKLKMRSSSSIRPTPILESRPWNLAESYPWSSQPFNVGLPAKNQEAKLTNPKPPKFKLKITRASSSTVGTVRINRESDHFTAPQRLHLRQPKDLFTPSSGIESLFRQVGRHFHSRKTSASSSLHPGERRATPSSALISNHTSRDQSFSSLLSTQHSQSSLNPPSPTELRSCFSDDSSQRRVGEHRLGRRISNLRARIVGPYGATNGTQSYDDITWRARNRQAALLPAASESVSNLHEERAGETKHLPRLLERGHAQKLRAKLTMWFKGARSAIRSRVKSRKMPERGDE